MLSRLLFRSNEAAVHPLEANALALDDIGQPPGWDAAQPQPQAAVLINGVPLSTPPNVVLRRLGIIEQHGHFKLEHLSYSASLDAWISDRTGQPMANVDPSQLSRRRDCVPRYLIQIVGTVDPVAAGTKTNPASILGPRSEASLAAPERVKIMTDMGANVESSSLVAGKGKTSSALQTKGTTNAAAVASTIEDPIKLIHQYLTSAIPATAKKLGAMIVYAGVGTEIPKLLAKGMSGSKKVECDSPSPNHCRRFLMLGVHGQQFHADPAYANKDLTHRLFLSTTISSPSSHLSSRNVPNEGNDVNNGNAVELVDSGQVMSYTNGLIEELLRLVPQKKKDRKDGVPYREPCEGICVVLVNGDKQTTKVELMRAVAKRWPILILEGSGGYADHLAQMVQQVETLAPNASLDDWRQYLGGTDPLTAEILINGRTTVVKLPRGPKPVDMGRYIEKALMGDEILMKCWQEYGTWKHQSAMQRKVYKAMQAAMLVCGMVAAGFAILMTFLLMLWENVQPKDMNPRKEWLVVIWYILQWSVIGLPIVISLLQAIANRTNPGVKWVCLRNASEDILNEIYRYRTHTGEFSSTQLKKKNTTADEVLQQKLRAITDTLYNSEVGGMTLLPQGGLSGGGGPTNEEINSVRMLLWSWLRRKFLECFRAGMTSIQNSRNKTAPPRKVLGHKTAKHLRKLGDDGFSTLIPDDYVRLRLLPTAKKYRKNAEKEERSLNVLTIIINFLGALGTAFAALAAYKWGSIQAWVAFTTCLVTTLTRHLDYSRTEWLQKKYNNTYQNLRNVATWWAALGQRADTAANRDRLIQLTEDLVAEEVDAWGQQLQQALAKERKNQQEDNDALMKTLKEQEGYKRAMKDLGMEDLTPEQIMMAIRDPKGKEAQKLKSTLMGLAGQLGGIVTSSVAGSGGDSTMGNILATGMAVARQVEFTLNQHVEILKRVSLGNFDNVPAAIASAVIADNNVRAKFFECIRSAPAHVAVGYMEMLLQAFAAIPNIFPSLQIPMPLRQVSEIVKALCAEELVCELFAGLPSEVVLRLRADVPNAEDLVAEWRSLVLDTHVRAIKAEQVLSVVKDQTIKNALLSIPLAAAATSTDLPNAVSAISASDPTNSNAPVDRTVALEILIRNATQLFGSNGGGDGNNAAVAQLMATGDPLLGAGAEAQAGRHAVVSLFEKVTADIAVMDMDELYRMDNSSLSLLTLIENVQRMPSLNPFMLPKDDLLKLFPASVSAKLQNKSQAQLARYVTHLQHGTPFMLLMSSLLVHVRIDPIATALEAAGAFEILPSLSPVLRERLALCTTAITQKDMCRLRKPALLKKLRMHPAFNDELQQTLDPLDPTALATLLGTMEALADHTFEGRLMTTLADRIHSFDLFQVLPDGSGPRLVAKMDGFRGRAPQFWKGTTTGEGAKITANIMNASNVLGNLMDAFSGQGKDNALRGAQRSVRMVVFGFLGLPDLVAAFENLEDYQLREFVDAWFNLAPPLLQIHAVANTLDSFTDAMSVAEVQRTASVWLKNSGFIERLAAILDEYQIQLLVRNVSHFASVEPILQLFGDQQIYEAFSGFPSESGQKILDLALQVRRGIGDRLICDVFETVLRELLPASDCEKFLRAFGNSDHRELLVRLFRPRLLPHDDSAPVLTNDSDPSLVPIRKLLDDNEELFQKVCRLVADEMERSLSSRLFHLVADQTRLFCLRGAISDRSIRCLLAPAVCEMLLRGKLEVSTSTTTEGQTRLSVTAAARTILQNLREIHPCFAPLNSDLRTLSEAQLKFVVEEMLNVLQTTLPGRFYFQFYCGDTPNPDQFQARYQRMLMCDALLTLRRKSAVFAQEVMGSLDGFDAVRFSTRKVDEMKRRFALHFENEAVVDFLTAMDATARQKFFQVAKAIVKPVDPDTMKLLFHLRQRAFSGLRAAVTDRLDQAFASPSG